MGYVESLMADNEHIVVRTRQHWTVLARSFLVNSFLVVVIIVVALAGMMATGPLGILAVLLWVIPFGLFTCMFTLFSRDSSSKTEKYFIP